MKRPFFFWILILVLILLSVGGFMGAIPMLADPASGGYLDFAELLPLLPVSSFFLPGLFLLVYMSLIPLLLAYALIARPGWSFLYNLI